MDPGSVAAHSGLGQTLEQEAFRIRQAPRNTVNAGPSNDAAI